MEELTKAKKRALYLLTDHDLTEKQLRGKLEKTGYSAHIIEKTIEYVRSFGYIDDMKYSVSYIEYYRSKKSGKRLRYDLLKKGVSADVVDSAFEDAGEWDERDQIRMLAEKKLSGKDIGDPKTYGIVANFLAGRGYRGEDIASVMREFFP